MSLGCVHDTSGQGVRSGNGVLIFMDPFLVVVFGYRSATSRRVYQSNSDRAVHMFQKQRIWLVTTPYLTSLDRKELCCQHSGRVGLQSHVYH